MIVTSFILALSILASSFSLVPALNHSGVPGGDVCYAFLCL